MTMDMTCIVGISYDGKVMLGADSAGVPGPFHFITLEPHHGH